MSKEKAKKEEEHDAEITKVITKVKASAVMAVWEVKIKLVEDVANVGSWNMAGWRTTLAELKGDFFMTSEDPKGQHPKEN